jgi:hypothetical protein
VRGDAGGDHRCGEVDGVRTGGAGEDWLLLKKEARLG